MNVKYIPGLLFAAALGAMFYYLPAPECRLPAAPAVGFSELFPSLRYDDGFDFAVAGVLPSNPTSAPQSGGAVFSVPYREIEIATLSAMTKPNSPGEVKNAEGESGAIFGTIFNRYSPAGIPSFSLFHSFPAAISPEETDKALQGSSPTDSAEEEEIGPIYAMQGPRMLISSGGRPAYAGTAKKPFLSSPVWRGESGKAAEAVKSDSAYANLATMTPGVDMVMPGYVCTDFAPKDIRVWGSARYASEKQDPLLYSAYDSTATTWELGFSKDWSIATTLGVSVSLLDAEVKAQGEGDGRKSEVLGYIIDGHMRTAILDRYPLRANFRLGRLENEGKGGYNLSGNNWSWHENKHNATLYGMSALAGLPLTFGDEYKLLLESGFIYNKLDAGSYNARLADPSGLNNDIAFSVEKRQLSSTSIPILATVKKDFIRCYGIITPRATVGIFREFDDSSMGLRAFNASAASSLLGDPASASLSNADDGSGMLYTANVGVDLITGSGWNMHADYEYLTGDEYKRHSFKLELAKCF